MRLAIWSAAIVSGLAGVCLFYAGVRHQPPSRPPREISDRDIPKERPAAKHVMPAATEEPPKAAAIQPKQQGDPPAPNGGGVFDGASLVFHLGAALLSDDPDQGRPKEPIRPRTLWHEDVQVTIDSASLASVTVKDLFGDRVSSGTEYLVVRLVIANRSSVRKVDYRGWADPFGFSSGHTATTTDEFGNSLKQVAFGFGNQVVGQIEKATSIYPGTSIEDVLIFERPVGRSKTLQLRLPAGTVGVDRPFVFEITRDAWDPSVIAAPTKKTNPIVPPLPQPKEDAAPKSEAKPVDDVQLIRIVGKGASARALIRLLPSGQTTLVKPGTKFGNDKWRVVDVDAAEGRLTVVGPAGKERTIAVDANKTAIPGRP